MIEKTILDYLNTNMQVSAYMEKPLSPPQRYLIIERTSGKEVDFLCSATVAIQSYAESLYEAASLNAALKAAMKSLVTVPKVSKVQLNSDYNYTDTTKKEYRYQAVFDIWYFE